MYLHDQLHYFITWCHVSDWRISHIFNLRPYPWLTTWPYTSPGRRTSHEADQRRSTWAQGGTLGIHAAGAENRRGKHFCVLCFLKKVEMNCSVWHFSLLMETKFKRGNLFQSRWHISFMLGKARLIYVNIKDLMACFKKGRWSDTQQKHNTS